MDGRGPKAAQQDSRSNFSRRSGHRRGRAGCRRTCATGQMLAPYSPDGGETYIKDTGGILFRAFHTTKDSRKERQPLVTPFGTVVCWDGRLDNREELIRELKETKALNSEATDLDITVAAYVASGTKCFARLTGDWAMSIWEPVRRSLLLAKDPIGTRHLYYSF